MSKISNICSKIIGLSMFLGTSAAIASPGSGFADIDAFSIGQIGSFMEDTVQTVGTAPALKHENPAVLRIESDYRRSHHSQMVKTLQQENLLNHIQMNEHAVYLQLRF